MKTLKFTIRCQPNQYDSLMDKLYSYDIHVLNVSENDPEFVKPKTFNEHKMRLWTTVLTCESDSAQIFKNFRKDFSTNLIKKRKKNNPDFQDDYGFYWYP